MFLPPRLKRDTSESKFLLNSANLDTFLNTSKSLVRGPDGKFSDDDLANVLQTATENPANSYGGQGTPACLKVIEIMGIEQARKWGVCTMNEFRKYLGLKRMSFLSSPHT